MLASTTVSPLGAIMSKACPAGSVWQVDWKCQTRPSLTLSHVACEREQQRWWWKKGKWLSQGPRDVCTPLATSCPRDAWVARLPVAAGIGRGTREVDLCANTSGGTAMHSSPITAVGVPGSGAAPLDAPWAMRGPSARSNDATAAAAAAAAAAAPLPPASIRVACVGDSLTASPCTTCSCPRKVGVERWPTLLRRLLGPSYAVGNYGVSESVADRAPPAWRAATSYWRTRAFAQARDFRAHVVLIMLGSNDARLLGQHKRNRSWWHFDGPRYVRELSAIARAFLRQGATRVVLLTPPPVWHEGPTQVQSLVVNGLLPTLVREAARAVGGGVEVLSIFEAARRQSPMIACDGLHLGAAGQIVVANAVARHLLTPLASRWSSR